MHGSSDTAPHILDLGTRSKCAVGLTAQPLLLLSKCAASLTAQPLLLLSKCAVSLTAQPLLLLHKKPHVLTVYEVGWTPETVWVSESAENSLAPD